MSEVILASKPTKLVRHIDKIKNLKIKPRPIMVDIALTSRCTQNCDFCYVKNREEGELKLEDIIHFLEVVKPLSIDLAGGEPTLWKDLDKLLEWCYDNNIKTGLITNGARLKDFKNLHLLDWLRISVNNYVDHKKEIYIPKLPGVYIGIMYVWHKDSKNAQKITWRLFKLKMRNPEIKYMKITEDFTDRTVHIPNVLADWGHPFIIETTIPRRWERRICYIGWLKPYLDCSGKVYFCTGNIEPLERRKKEGSEFCTIYEPEKLLEYFDFKRDCQRCENYGKNKFIDMVLADHIIHEEFI